MKTWFKVILLSSMKGMRSIWILNAPSIVTVSLLVTFTVTKQRLKQLFSKHTLISEI